MALKHITIMNGTRYCTATYCSKCKAVHWIYTDSPLYKAILRNGGELLAGDPEKWNTENIRKEDTLTVGRCKCTKSFED